MTAFRLDLARPHILTTSSLVVSGGTLTVYENGTTTLVDLFSDRDLGTSSENPLVADTAGRFPVCYLDEAQLLTIECRDASGVLMWTVDDYEPFAGALAGIDLSNADDNSLALSKIAEVTGPVFLGRIANTLGDVSAIALSESFIVAASDEVTAITTGTGKISFRMPYAFALTQVRGSLSTAQTSGSVFQFDVKEAGVSIFSTKPTFDNTEKTTKTAATPAVISDAQLADDAEITIDVTQVGNGTAMGLKVTLIGYRVA